MEKGWNGNRGQPASGPAGVSRAFRRLLGRRAQRAAPCARPEGLRVVGALQPAGSEDGWGWWMDIENARASGADGRP